MKKQDAIKNILTWNFYFYETRSGQTMKHSTFKTEKKIYNLISIDDENDHTVTDDNWK